MNFIKYEKIKNFSDIDELHNVYGYVIKKYEPGLSIVIDINKDKSSFSVGDWNTNYGFGDKQWLELSLGKFIDEKYSKLLNIMVAAGITNAQFYFSKCGKLVDMIDISNNKFVGPGMLRDIFGKIFEIQECIKICVFNDDELCNISGCILKPSKFKTINGNIPMYGMIN